MTKIMSERGLPLVALAISIGTWLVCGHSEVLGLPSGVLISCVVITLGLWPKFALPAAAYLMGFALTLWARPPIGILLIPALVGVLCLALREKPGVRIAAACFLALPLAGLSGGAGSANGWQESLMAWFHWSSGQADLAVLCIRRFIHLMAYGLIGWSLFRAATALPLKLQFAVAALWVGGHAAFDELRQYVTPGRSGRLEDFLIDLTGATVFIGIACWQSRGSREQVT